jgi:hypothetical protein
MWLICCARRIVEDSPAVINNAILNADDLLATTGYERDGDLRRSLDDQRVPYFVGKGGRPWTTIGLIEAAKGLRVESVPAKPVMYSPDDA